MNIYDFVKTEENTYRTRPIPVFDGYEWHMCEKINEWTIYKDGQLKTGKTDDKPVKNIILPILNFNYRTEGFDVKDIELYVDSADDYHKSFLIRKYHDKVSREWGIDTMIDEIVQSYVDYGGVLTKKIKGSRPEVIPLMKLAFCDQTDILSGPFAIKHQYSIDQLKEKSGTWNEEAINDVISNARQEKDVQQSEGRTAQTPGKYIEVYEVHGVFPKSYLTRDTDEYFEDDEINYSQQIHIITYCTTEDPRQLRGVTLFKGKEAPGLFKVLKRDERFGTALGRSAIEELVESQVWTNYSMIQVKAILDKAALMLGVTDDVTFSQNNKFTDLEQGEWLIKQPNTSVEPFIFPTSNLQQFEQAVQSWELHARTTGSANEAALGVSPASGTPFRLQDLVVDENKGMHTWRQGRIATFVEELYRDWIIPEMAEEMNKGQKFLADLSIEELEEVADKVITKHVNSQIVKKIMTGKILKPEDSEMMKTQAKELFMKNGTKRFIELFKGEIRDIPIDVKVNVAGKQKNLNSMTDKIVNVFREVIVNPQVLQDPNAVKAFNKILEFSGLSPINFKPVPMQNLAAEEELPTLTTNQ